MKLVYLLCLVPILCSAQSPITPEDRQKAGAFFTAGDWNNAIAAYKRIADAEPQNANARYRLASSFAAIGKKDEAFQWLEQAAKYGFAQLTTFESDKNLSQLKADPRYEKSKELILRMVYPCRYAEKSREFDFWIGEWDVKNTQGQPAGKSKIELMLGDCVIYENWVSAAPNLYSGKSFNLYNASTQKWMQTWVDDKGAVIEFINGEYKDNKMVFVTLPDAQQQITRLTFYNIAPNQVRQRFETTKDAGKTWTTTTDLMYFKVN